MENREDKILTDFFTAHKKEIADDGFSRRVMRSLPEQTKIRWIIPAFTLMGLVLTLLLVDLRGIMLKVYFLIEQLPLIYIAGVFFIIPLVLLIVWYVNEKEYRVFG